MWHKRMVATIVALLLMNSWLCAGVVPGRWEKVEGLEQGSTIIVTLVTGDTVQGEFNCLKVGSLRMTVDTQEQEFPKSAVSRISQLEMGWSRKKRVGICGLIGFAAGFALGCAGAANAADQDNMPAGETIKCGFAIGGVGAGIGAAIGSAQKPKPKEIVIYEARVPEFRVSSL